jgi:hypothetical protein
MSDKFQISIQDNDLKKVTLLVSKEMKIREVKDLYYKKTEKTQDNKKFMLFYNVKKLDDDKTLGFYKVKKNATLKYLSVEQNIIAAKNFFFK